MQLRSVTMNKDPPRYVLTPRSAGVKCVLRNHSRINLVSINKVDGTYFIELSIETRRALLNYPSGLFKRTQLLKRYLILNLQPCN